MKLLSINTGLPKDFQWQGKTISTSIFKSPVNRSCKVKFLNIEGDKQADLVDHGGIDKAVYSYDYKYYPYWKKTLARNDWEYGMFGENLTTQGLTDDKVRIGNIYRIGSAMLRAVQPRFPCFKLEIRFGRDDMIKKFYDSKRFGTYFRVEQEGNININDKIELIEESKETVTIQDVVNCKVHKGKDQSKLKKILSSQWLPQNLRESLRMYLKS
ncbi:MAG: MOSC domain-containing protein [bacterium]